MIARYSHPDGGEYVIAEYHALSVKMDDGRWEPAVMYRRVVRGATGQYQYEGKNQFVTTKARWAERFTRIEE